MSGAIVPDLHVLRYFSAVVSVSGGKVINVTDPSLESCPLAGYLYKGFRKIRAGDKDALKLEIKRVVEHKIRELGFFTPGRRLSADKVAIPCGASEILMRGLKKKAVDAAVIVCDGAGTIVTEKGNVVQGVGARMNSLISTSPIKEVMEMLKALGCLLVSEDALIDQVQGVKKAIAAGYRRIAVTVCGKDAFRLKDIRALGSKGAVITILVVCTTSVGVQEIKEFRRYADIVWSCASFAVRREIGRKALLQVSTRIPVFVLTPLGVSLIEAYSENGGLLRSLDISRQYLISNEPKGAALSLGGLSRFIREAELPVPAGESSPAA